ncbi:MAG: SRPBCC family protein [Erythrobacter sp.]
MLRSFAVAALCALLLPLAEPAQAEVTKSDENGFVTRDTAVVKASPKEVWLALISPAKWWNSAHTWSGDAANLTLMPKAGGCFCERIPEVPDPVRATLEGSAEHMRVVQAYPERALRMRGSLGPLQSEPVSGVLTISISEAEQGTRIVWEYVVGGYMRYEVGKIAPPVDAVMSEQLARLAKLLGPVDAPGEAAPSPPAAAPAPEPAAEPSLEQAIDQLADN